MLKEARNTYIFLFFLYAFFFAVEHSIIQIAATSFPSVKSDFRGG